MLKTPLPITYDDVRHAHCRISPWLNATPMISSSQLNRWLGHEIIFKAECFQVTGSFKIRGALNTLLKVREQNTLPKQVVCNSSGNHAQAVAFAAKVLELPCTVFCPETISSVKKQATEAYGAEVVLCKSRHEADERVREISQKSGVFWLPPYNHPDVIAGQGTLALDAFSQLSASVDAIAAPCGGGGLLSGTYVARQQLAPSTEILGVEPLLGNDAAQSREHRRIVSLSKSPDTLADGAATLSLGEWTFPFIQQVDHFTTANEDTIAYWTQWLQHLLKIHIEPTCAMTMAGVTEWLQQQTTQKRVLVLISGGNISTSHMQRIWAVDRLSVIPSLSSHSRECLK